MISSSVKMKKYEPRRHGGTEFGEDKQSVVGSCRARNAPANPPNAFSEEEDELGIHDLLRVLFRSRGDGNYDPPERLREGGPEFPEHSPVFSSPCLRVSVVQILPCERMSMSEPAIRVTGLGKQYRIGVARQRYATLRETITEAFRRVGRYSRSGEVVGVIGRNQREELNHGGTETRSEEKRSRVLWGVVVRPRPRGESGRPPIPPTVRPEEYTEKGPLVGSVSPWFSCSLLLLHTVIVTRT